MTLSATSAPESTKDIVPTTDPAPISDIEQDTLESLLQGRERLEEEFAAIMTVSGFGDRIVVTTLTPQGPELVSRRRERDRIFRATSRVSAIRRHPRVRSPPDRP